MDGASVSIVVIISAKGSASAALRPDAAPNLRGEEVVSPPLRLTVAASCSHALARTADNDKAANMPGETVHHDTPHRAMITACAIGATVLQLLDQTIANVALPYMQGSFSSSYDEITWVLTSYITASAIMTAPVGWLAAR